MALLVLANLQRRTQHQSDRCMLDVLTGEDIDTPFLLQLCDCDATAAKALLSQPQYSEIMLEERLRIVTEERPATGPGDFRKVEAGPITVLAHAVMIMALGDRSPAINALLEFAAEHGLAPSEVITHEAYKMAVRYDRAAAVEAFIVAVPELINYRLLGYGTAPLYEAVSLNAVKVVETLIRLGADLQHPAGDKKLGSFDSSLLSKAAACKGPPHMVELLLKHGVAIPGSGALHTAVAFNSVEAARLLVDRGADVNEVLVDGGGSTPLHYAVGRNSLDAVKSLKQMGARIDIRDNRGLTPDELGALWRQQKAEKSENG